VILIVWVDASREAARSAPRGLGVLVSRSAGEAHAERAVAALAVEDDLDGVEHLGSQLRLRRPRAAVDELLLEVAKKLSATALS
jgi:hypothetical protein